MIRLKIESPEVKNSPMAPQSSGLFKTEELFALVDVRQYRYLDVQGIQSFMETYFKYMINRHNGFDPLDIDGTGFALDTRPKFMAAIMRRLGFDMSKKIDYQEFSKLLKPSPVENLVNHFEEIYMRDRVGDVNKMSKQMDKYTRDA